MKDYLNARGMTLNDIIVSFIIAILIISGGIGSGILCYSTKKSNYQYSINNPITINEIEEDLEEIFITTNAEVIKGTYVIDDDCLFVDVKANGYTYRVLYKLKKYCCNYRWEYQKNVLIKE